MREIMEVAKFIRKEVARADMYAYEAVKHKEQYPDLAQHYYKAAQDHLAIADSLHTGAVRMIDMTKRSGASLRVYLGKVRIEEIVETCHRSGKGH